MSIRGRPKKKELFCIRQYGRGKQPRPKDWYYIETVVSKKLLEDEEQLHVQLAANYIQYEVPQDNFTRPIVACKVKEVTNGGSKHYVPAGKPFLIEFEVPA